MCTLEDRRPEARLEGSRHFTMRDNTSAVYSAPADKGAFLPTPAVIKLPLLGCGSVRVVTLGLWR